jgi:hypothetical protein
MVDSKVFCSPPDFIVFCSWLHEIEVKRARQRKKEFNIFIYHLPVFSKHPVKIVIRYFHLKALVKVLAECFLPCET